MSAFQADVIASCVGPVTAAAFELWGVPTIYPERSRLAAMVKQLEVELPSRRSGLTIELLGGSQLLLHGDDVLLVTKKGKMIRFPVTDVKLQGRNTMGVRIVDLDADDQVGSLARVEAEQTPAATV